MLEAYRLIASVRKRSSVFVQIKVIDGFFFCLIVCVFAELPRLWEYYVHRTKQNYFRICLFHRERLSEQGIEQGGFFDGVFVVVVVSVSVKNSQRKIGGHLHQPRNYSSTQSVRAAE